MCTGARTWQKHMSHREGTGGGMGKRGYLSWQQWVVTNWSPDEKLQFETPLPISLYAFSVWGCHLAIKGSLTAGMFYCFVALFLISTDSMQRLFKLVWQIFTLKTRVPAWTLFSCPDNKYLGSWFIICIQQTISALDGGHKELYRPSVGRRYLFHTNSWKITRNHGWKQTFLEGLKYKSILDNHCLKYN